MAYENGSGGRIENEVSGGGRIGDPRKDAGLWTFAAVEERLVAAMRLWRRAPDRERAWLHVRAFWPDIRRVGIFRVVGGEADHPEHQPEPRKLPLTRADIAEMEAAGELIGLIPERDRKLATMALAFLAAGAKHVPWETLWNANGRGRPGPDGLRLRYSRALTGVARRLNGELEKPSL